MKFSTKQFSWTHGVMALVTAAATLFVFRANPVAADSGSTSYEPSQVVVRINPASGATIANINATFGTTTLESLPSVAGTFRLQVPAGQDAKVFAASMAADMRLAYAEVNFISEPPEANPRRIAAWGGLDSAPYTGQYALNLLGLPQAQAIAQGSGITVAILDTGVQLNHPALAGSLTTARYDYIDGDAIPEDAFDQQDNDSDGLIDEAAGHGTHVAGIVHLVAPQAKLMPVRVLDSDGHGDTFNVAKAIAFAVQNGAKVINLSLGTADKVNVLDDAVKQATSAGVFVVAAAGNLNVNQLQWPAGSNCALAITSVGASDVKSDFSNFGSWVDVSAPGESIYSPFPPSGYAVWSGTSMSTPFVAGQAALLLSKSSTLTPRDVGELIAGTAHNIDSQNPDFVGKLGNGRIDVIGSLQQLATGTLPDVGGVISGSCVEPVAPPAATLTPTSTSLVPTQTPMPNATQPLGSEARFYGLVTSRPSGLVGTWVLGTRSFLANNSTEFQFVTGPLNVGVCAKVKYVSSGGTDIALEIESEPASDCSGITATPTATPNGTPTATPSVTSTPTPADGFTNRAYGILSQFPSNLIGAWIVNGTSYTTTTATEFHQDSGAFANGVCVKVKYTGQNVALEIETEPTSDCSGGSGGGQPPSLPGLSKVYATIGSLPASPFVGAWMIGGLAYQAISSTQFKQERGTFAKGACVEAKYTSASGTNTLVEVESHEAYKCQSMIGDNPAPVFESYGVVEQFPASLRGDWQVSAISYTTDLSTTFQQEHGTFALGAFVEVKYRVVNNVRVAVKIETHVEPGAGQGNSAGQLDTRPSDDWGTWIVDGQPYQGDHAIEVEIHSSSSQRLSPLAVQKVSVNYYVSGGIRYATSIRELTRQVFMPLSNR